MSAIAEYARAIQQQASAIMFDVIKAFESIDHLILFQHARRCNFSLVVLRFLLNLYSMPRTVKVGQIATKIVCASRSVVPGCSFADLMMRLMLMPTMDFVVRQWSSLHVGVVVNDVQILAIGGRAVTQFDMVEAGGFIITDLG